MDRLSSLLGHISIGASVFEVGVFCGSTEIPESAYLGYLHFLQEGAITISMQGKPDMSADAPALILLSQPAPHRLRVNAAATAKLACASVFLGGEGSPLRDSLPAVLAVPLGDKASLHSAIALFFAEAWGAADGRQAVIDRLAETMLILLLRHLIETGHAEVGTLAGLADARLCRALTAIHAEPSRPWRLESLADAAHMSRSNFAARFREIVGTTPADYIARLRLSLAAAALREGKTVAQAARKFGYGSASAFSRAYHRLFGHPPKRLP